MRLPLNLLCRKSHFKIGEDVPITFCKRDSDNTIARHASKVMSGWKLIIVIHTNDDNDNNVLEILLKDYRVKLQPAIKQNCIHITLKSDKEDHVLSNCLKISKMLCEYGYTIESKQITCQSQSEGLPILTHITLQAGK